MQKNLGLNSAKSGLLAGWMEKKLEYIQLD